MLITKEELIMLIAMTDSYVRLFEKEGRCDNIDTLQSIRNKLIKELAKELYFN